MTADKIGRSRPVTKIDAGRLVLPPPGRPAWAETQSRATRHGVKVPVRNNKDLTSFERNGLSVVAKQWPLPSHVIGNR